MHNFHRLFRILMPFALLWIAVPSWSQAPPLMQVVLPFGGEINRAENLSRDLPVQAIAVGHSDTEFASPLNLYAFDGRGNCVAWDDPSPGPVCDRVAIAFVPQQTGAYYLQARNLGAHWSHVEFVVNHGR